MDLATLIATIAGALSIVGVVVGSNRGLKRDLGARIDRVDTKVDGVEARLGARIDGVEARIDGVEARLGARIDGVEARLEGVEARLGARIDGVDERLGTLDDRVYGLAVRLAPALAPTAPVAERPEPAQP